MVPAVFSQVAVLSRAYLSPLYLYLYLYLYLWRYRALPCVSLRYRALHRLV